MKLIASVSPNFSKKAPIAAMSNGYLCYAVNSTIFTYKNTKNFCFESSIDLKFSPNSLSILSNLYSRTLYLIAYDTQNIAIYDLLNRNLYSTEQKYSQIKTDPFSQNSFLSLSEFKYFNKNSIKTIPNYSIMNDFTFNIEENVQEDQGKCFEIAKPNSNTALILTKLGDILILRRRNPNFPFKLHSKITYISDDELITNLCSMNFNLFLVWSSHFIHLVHSETSSAFLLLSFKQDLIIKDVIATDSEEKLAFYVIFDNNIIEYYELEDHDTKTNSPIKRDSNSNLFSTKVKKLSALSKPISIQLDDDLVFSVLGSKNEDLFLIDSLHRLFIVKHIHSNESNILCITLSSQFPLINEQYLNVLSSFSKYIVYIGIDNYLTVYNHEENSVVYHDKFKDTPIKISWFDDNSFCYLTQNNKVYYIENHGNDIFIQEDNPIIEFNDDNIIYEMKTTKNYTIYRSNNDSIGVWSKKSNTIISQKNIDGIKSYSTCETQLQPLVGNNDANTDYESLIIAMTVSSKGILFSDENMEPIIGIFPQLSHSFDYTSISLSIPKIFVFDSSGRLFIFDLVNKKCVGHIQAQVPIYSIVNHNFRSLICSQSNGEIIVYSSSPSVLETISSLSVDQILSIYQNKIYYSTRTGISFHYLEDFSPNSNESPVNIEFNIFDLPPPSFLSEKSAEKRVNILLNILNIAIDPHEFVDDLKILLGYGMPENVSPSTCKDVKKLYHRHVISFANSEISEESSTQIKEFIQEFDQLGENLDCAVLYFIIKEYDECFSYLIKGNYFDVATLFGSKYNIENYKQQVLSAYIQSNIESGDIIHSILGCYYTKQYQKTASLLYLHEYYKLLEKLNLIVPFDDFDFQSNSEEMGFLIDTNTLKECIKQKHKQNSNIILINAN